jgi:hypothetical protein
MPVSPATKIQVGGTFFALLSVAAVWFLILRKRYRRRRDPVVIDGDGPLDTFDIDDDNDDINPFTFPGNQQRMEPTVQPQPPS